MSGSKHTPGPWAIVKRSSDGKSIHIESDHERDNWNCLRCEVESDDCNSEMAMANAHLISAAPELLSACEAIVEFHASNYDPLLGVSDSLVRELNRCVVLARAAIAKSNGGAA